MERALLSSRRLGMDAELKWRHTPSKAAPPLCLRHQFQPCLQRFRDSIVGFDRTFIMGKKFVLVIEKEDFALLGPFTQNS
jgi:hypothetical protein